MALSRCGVTGRAQSRALDLDGPFAITPEHSVRSGTASAAGLASAAEGPVPRGIPHLDHVFVIMMENHGYAQIIGNPSMPFVNGYARRANLATNYFAVAHPSLTNYLEVTGGSNFGVLNDNAPDWHDASCTTNLALGQPSLDNGSNPLAGEPICPIGGIGTDAATPARAGRATKKTCRPPELISSTAPTASGQICRT